jgi:arylsulfatase A-like enzyme
MDIFPTILDLTGIEKPYKIDGVSLVNHMLHQRPLDSRTLFWDTGKSIAARKGKWKLVLPEPNSKPELYDLGKDLEEMDNVADQNPSIVKELFSELKDWEVSVNKGVKKYRNVLL